MSNVTAARHNNLQARLELILGNGSGSNGYGQGTRYGTSLDSFPVSNTEGSNTNIITAEAMNALYKDMVRCRIHQVGTEPNEIAELIANLNVIAENTSFIVGDDGIVVQDENGNKKGIVDYENLMSTIESDKFLIHSGTLENGISTTRTTVWNGQVKHEFRVTFIDGNHRRHFFNSGGELRISANNSGAATAKGLDWAALLSGMGTIKFNHTATSSTGDGNETLIGNYDLSTSYQLIYRKVGGGYVSGVYNGNIYEIYAKEANDYSIDFRIIFNDVVDNGFADENVDGRLQSIIQHYRADSEVVTVAAPNYANTIALGSTVTPVPTYSVSPVSNQVELSNQVDENNSVTFNVSTTSIANGTNLYWTIRNADTSNADFTSTSGSVAISSNSGSFDITATADSLTEGVESFRVELRTGSTSGPIVAVSSIVTINDTSTTPVLVPSYSVTLASSNVIGEGDTAVYRINTTNVPNGTTLFYSLVGTVEAEDFTVPDTLLTGSFTTTNDETFVNVTTLADSVTEGSETFQLQLRTGGISGTIVAISDPITIQDTSTDPVIVPTYTLSASSSSVNEGDTLVMTLGTTDVAVGTTLYYTLSGDTTGNDFTTPSNTTSGNFTTAGDVTTFSIVPSSDLLTEGSEVFKVFVRTGSTSGTIVAQSNDITINDTSQEPVVSVPIINSLDWDVDIVNIGTSAIIEWNTSNTTHVNYEVTEFGGSGAIFASGSFEPSIGQSSPITFSTTGNYIVTLTAVGTDQNITGTALIQAVEPVPVINNFSWSDTSVGYQETSILSWDITGATQLATDSYNIQLSITRAEDGVSFTLTDLDNVDTYSASFVGGTYIASITATNTAGSVTETATLSVSNEPTYSFAFSSVVINEDQTATFELNTTNVPNGTTLYYSVDATTADITNLTGSFSISNNAGSFIINPVDDNEFEPDETFNVRLRTDSVSGPIVANATLTIRESDIPTYSITPTNVSVNEGETQTFIVSSDVPVDGTTLYYTIEGAGSDFGFPQGTITMSGSTGSFSVQPALDGENDDNETFTINVRTDSYTGDIVASTNITLNDVITVPINRFNYSISQDLKNPTLRTLLIDAGWNESDEVDVEITSGVRLYTDSNLAYGLVVNGSYPNGLRIRNFGKITGAGGKGGGWSVGDINTATEQDAEDGGVALAIASSNVTVVNYGYIAGGGGGGGLSAYSGGGGGAGGGNGGAGTILGWPEQYFGGTGSSFSTGGDGLGYTTVQAGKGGGAGGGGGAGADFGSSELIGGSGGGGGGILPGVGGASGDPNNVNFGGTGPDTGEGGSAGNPGSPGASAYGIEDVAGGGGGWGAAGGTGTGGRLGGAGGAAIQTNTSYTLINNGTIYGTT